MAQRSLISPNWRSNRPERAYSHYSSFLPAVRRAAGIGLALAALALGSGAARAQDDSAVPPSPEAPLSGPDCKAASAVLVDAETGTVLWERNPHVRRPIASTTKIMTATLILESGRLDDVVTFSDHARQTPYANLNALPGEQFRMRDLLYAILMRSSNDSCVAAAEHLSGEAWKFAQQMTEKAHLLGCVDTNFVTVNGLYHPQHYSSAFDLAVMTRYAARYPLFNQIVGTQETSLSRTLNHKDTLLKNHNKFLARYQGADGVKTGYVKQSGKCLVASATHLEGTNPWRLITVVLNSPDPYGDSARMMDWGHKNFQPIFFAHRGEEVSLAPVEAGTRPRVPLVAAEDLMAVIRRDSGKNMQREVHAEGTIEAPVRQSQPGGRLVGLIDGKPVAQVPLVAEQPVSRIWTASLAPWSSLPLGVVGLFLVPRYARTVAKSARRRRRRLAARRRELDRGGES